MKRILIVAAASFIAASRTSAADLPVRPGAPAYYPVATVYDWGGGYIGINGGYAFGQSEWSDPQNPSGIGSTGNFNVNGALIGGTMGISGQFGAFVLGAEGDLDWQNVSGTNGGTFCASIITSTVAGVGTGGGLSCKTKSTWLGTVRARGGYAWDRILLYGTVGIAGANMQTGLSGLPPQTNFVVGWTAGAGLEWAFAENWTIKVEYLFVDLNNATCNHGYSCGYDFPAAVNQAGGVINFNSNNTVKFDENIVRVGVNFKFGH
jgi:outer membrane immunogenic protein